MSTLPTKNMPLPQRVKAAREIRGLSQEKLAFTTGLTRRHVIRIENGQVTNLLPGTAVRISEALGFPSDFFIDVSDDEEEAAAMAPLTRGDTNDLLEALRPLASVLDQMGVRA